MQFKELELWKSALAMAHSVYLTIEAGRFFKDQPLRDEIKTASFNLVNNIGECGQKYQYKDILKSMMIVTRKIIINRKNTVNYRKK